jgi:hypothetical protein
MAIMRAGHADRALDRLERYAERLRDATDQLERSRVRVDVHDDRLDKLDAQFRRLQGRLYGTRRGEPALEVDDDLAALINYQSAPPAKPQ